MKKITVKRAIKYLRDYQQWRRGEADMPQPSPAMVSACIEVVLDALEKKQ